MIELAPTGHGRISVAARVLAELVTRAAGDVDGVVTVRSGRALHVHVEDGAPAVELAVVAAMGAPLPDVGRRLQERVAAALETALGTAPRRVDVTIESIVARQGRA